MRTAPFGPEAVDAKDFPVVILDADEAQGMRRPERHLGRQPAAEPFAPERFGGAVGRVDPAIEAGAHQSGDRRQAPKGCNVAAPAADMGFQIGGNQPRIGFDPVEDPRQQRLFQAAIAQPSDRGNRDRDQRNHRDGKPGCERHLRFRAPSRPLRACGRANPAMLFRITGRKQHRRRHGMAMTTGAWRLPGSRSPPPAGPRA